MLFSEKITLKGFSDFLISKKWTKTHFLSLHYDGQVPSSRTFSPAICLWLSLMKERIKELSERKASTMKKIRHSVPSWILSIFLSVSQVSKKCPKSVTRTWVCWYTPHWQIRKRELNIYVQPQVNSSGSWTPEMDRLLSSRFESGSGMDSSTQLKEKCTLKPCKTRHTLLSPETILN